MYNTDYFQHYLGNIWQQLRQPDYDSAVDPAYDADMVNGWIPVQSQQGPASYKLFQHRLSVLPMMVQVLVQAVSGPNKGMIFEVTDRFQSLLLHQ